jgi:hypothetical protein
LWGVSPVSTVKAMSVTARAANGSAVVAVLGLLACSSSCIDLTQPYNIYVNVYDEFTGEIGGHERRPPTHRPGEHVVVFCAVGGTGSMIYRGDFSGTVVVDVECPPGIEASPGQWTVDMVDGHDVPTEVTLHIADDASPGEYVIRFKATVAGGYDFVSSPGDWKVLVEAGEPAEEP